MVACYLRRIFVLERDRDEPIEPRGFFVSSCVERWSRISLSCLRSEESGVTPGSDAKEGEQRMKVLQSVDDRCSFKTRRNEVLSMRCHEKEKRWNRRRRTR
jgi:hypothetical protein